jgi:hypothetical protein
MTKPEFLQNAKQTFQECLAILNKKSADYATSQDPFKNFRMFESVPGFSVEQGIIYRIGDKLSRIATLLNGTPEVKDESVSDTLSDLINYTAILKIWLEQTQSKTNETKNPIEPSDL